MLKINIEYMSNLYNKVTTALILYRASKMILLQMQSKAGLLRSLFSKTTALKFHFQLAQSHTHLFICLFNILHSISTWCTDQMLCKWQNIQLNIH